MGITMSDQPAQKSTDTAAALDSQRTQNDDAVSVLALRLIAANARVNAIALVTAVILIALGIWVHGGIKSSLQEIREAGMRSMLHCPAGLRQSVAGRPRSASS